MDRLWLGYGLVMVRLWSGYGLVMVRLSSGYHPVIVRLSSSHRPVIVQLLSGYHPVIIQLSSGFCPSPTDSLISLRYSMPVFSANLLGLFAYVMPHQYERKVENSSFKATMNSRLKQSRLDINALGIHFERNLPDGV